jgi:alpha-tubulin suppressor-like RCC1 family protein
MHDPTFIGTVVANTIITTGNVAVGQALIVYGNIDASRALNVQGNIKTSSEFQIGNGTVNFAIRVSNTNTLEVFNSTYNTLSSIGGSGGAGNLSNLSSHVIPSNNAIYDLGSATKRWRNLYLGGSAINFSNGINFDTFDWSYLLEYIVPPKELDNPSARKLFSGSPDGHAGFIASNKPYMFGRNNVGQLGLGDTTNRPVPTLVRNITDAVGIACGSDFTCIITSSGTAWAFGRNANGQLGDGTTTDRSSPVAVNGISTAIGVAAGQGHVLYLLANGSVVGYGSDANGQLGNGTTASNSVNATLAYVTMPSPTDPTFKARYIACGSYHSVMVLENGSCYTFGDNTYNQLGVTLASSSSTPVIVPGISNVVSAACGEYHTLLVRYDGEVLSCGRNNSGQCGVGNTSTVTAFTSIWTGTELSSKGLSISVDGGTGHSILALDDGTVKVFGTNATGQLGVGPSVASYVTPTTLNGYSAYSVACGKDFSFLLLKNSAVYSNAIVAFGNNVYGNMGDSQTNVALRWIPNRIYEDASTRKLVSSASSSGSTGYIETDGVAYVCGTNADYQLGDGWTNDVVTSKPVSGILPRIASISFSTNHMLAIDGNGTLWAVGNNVNGQLGDGTNTNRSRPVQLTAPTLNGKTFMSVACGLYHNAAIDSTGALYMWGLNNVSQLGDGLVTSRNVPFVITGGAISGKTIVSVQCGAFHTIALDSLGSVYAWGFNAYGQVGDGTTVTKTIPTLISGGSLLNTIVIAISAGTNHTMALSRSGTLCSWGLNTNGQLGDATVVQKTTPVGLSGGTAANTTFCAIACGSSHSLALDTAGRIHAFGLNTSGQLGDTTVTQRTSPILITGGTLSGKSVVGIAGSNVHTMAIASDGSIHTWGSGANGRLGYGTNTSRLVPGLLTGLDRDSFVKVFSEGYSGTHKLLMNRDIYGNKKILDVVGTNTYSQLGDSTNVDKFYAVTLPAFTYDIVSASNSNDHSGIVLSNGSVYLWGRNTTGQCGPLNAGTATNVNVPTLLGGIGNASRVYCGDGFTLILLQDKTVMALGSNATYKLGNASIATASYTTTPVYVTGLSQITQIACGPNFGLACTVSGTLWTWGSNATGSTGLGTSTGSTQIPTQVPENIVNVDGDRVVGVAAGETHAVVLIKDTYNRQKVFSSGTNLYGQLGRSANVFTSDIVSNFGLVTLPATSATPLRIACGRFHTILHMSNHRAYTFGRNNATQLGFSGSDTSTPYLMSDLDISSIASGNSNTYIEFIGAKIKAYGTYYSTINGRILANGLQDQGFISGKKGGGSSQANHSAILTRTGQVGTFGYGGNGQLGDGSGARSSPIWISDYGSLLSNPQKRIVAIACGSSTTILLDHLGGIHGIGIYPGDVSGSKTVPVDISSSGSLNGKFIVAISSGTLFSFAVDSDGGLHGWGLGTTGQLGNTPSTTSATPVQTSSYGSLIGKFIVAVSCGDLHAMTLDSAGGVHAWGERSNGRQGDGFGGTTSIIRGAPAAIVPSLWTGKVIVAISCGSTGGAAIDSDGVLYAWGLNQYGEVGNGTQTVVSTPIVVSGGGLTGKIVVAVSCGSNHTLALTSDGIVCAWGNNATGQLGDNTVAIKLIPTTITALSSINKIVVSISAGKSSSYAKTSTDEMYAWGDNTYGQLGDGTTTQRTVPTLTSTAAMYTNFNQGSGTTPIFVNFTGQHRVFVKGYASRDLPRLEGLIVVSDQNSYMTPTRRGQSAITINESLPIVSLAATPNDKRAFGVISLSYNESPLSAEQKYQLHQEGDIRIHTNSVGEGAMWVCDVNGPFECGDLITTSFVTGYGMRQDDDTMRNYTVGKITMICDFSVPMVGVQEISKDVYGQTVLDPSGVPIWDSVMDTDGEPKLEEAYKVRYLDAEGNILSKETYDARVAEGLESFRAAFVGCTYHCG